MIPKVSVMVTSYNHEQYIRAALEGVFAQQASFPIEVLVCDDASSDGTKAIVEEFCARYPDRVRALFQERNRGDGGDENFLLGLEACRGEYIAILDGDDYWSDVSKLQRQADLLDAEPECSLCFHACEVRYDAEEHDSWNVRSPSLRDRLTTDDLLDKAVVQMSTIVVRRQLAHELRQWPHLVGLGDWSIAILASRSGPIRFIDRSMGVCRHHDRGTWSSKSRAGQWSEFATAYDDLKTILGAPYRNTLERGACVRAYLASVEYERIEEFELAGTFLSRALQGEPAWLEPQCASLGVTGDDLFRMLTVRLRMYRRPMLFHLWRAYAKASAEVRWRCLDAAIGLRRRWRLVRGEAIGILAASPNPAPVDFRFAAEAQSLGLAAVTLDWTATDTDTVEVRVGRPDGSLFSHSLAAGKAETGPWVGDGTTFFLQDVSDGRPLTLVHTLAVVRVRVREHAPPANEREGVTAAPSYAVSTLSETRDELVPEYPERAVGSRTLRGPFALFERARNELHWWLLLVTVRVRSQVRLTRGEAVGFLAVLREPLDSTARGREWVAARWSTTTAERLVAGTTICVEAQLQCGSIPSEGVGVYLGTFANGYAFVAEPAGLRINKSVDGVVTVLGTNLPMQSDWTTGYHSFRFSITVHGVRNNAMRGAYDGIDPNAAAIVRDRSLDLTSGQWPAMLFMGGDGFASSFSITTAPGRDVNAKEIRLGRPDGPRVARGGAAGLWQIDESVFKGATLFLQDVSGGRPPTSENTLDVVRVKRMRRPTGRARVFSDIEKTAETRVSGSVWRPRFGGLRAGATLSVEVDLRCGSTPSEGLGIIVGSYRDGYAVCIEPTGLYLVKSVAGTASVLGVILTTDDDWRTGYHTLRLSVTVNGAHDNSLRGSCDGIDPNAGAIVNDSSLNLTDGVWPVAFSLGGDDGGARNLSIYESPAVVA